MPLPHIGAVLRNILNYSVRASVAKKRLRCIFDIYVSSDCYSPQTFVVAT